MQDQPQLDIVHVFLTAWVQAIRESPLTFLVFAALIGVGVWFKANAPRGRRRRRR